MSIPLVCPSLLLKWGQDRATIIIMPYATILLLCAWYIENMNIKESKAILNICLSYHLTPFKKLRSQCQAFAEKQCNEPVTEKYIKERENFLESRARKLLGIDYIPKWLQLYGDPRGFVAYIKSEEIEEEQKELLRSYRVPQDFGGNYAIGELPNVIKRHYNKK